MATYTVSFSTRTDYAVTFSPSAVVAADLDGDGKLDLAVSGGGYTNNVAILLGNGNGTFQAPLSYALGTNAQSLSFADFNGDGKVDLVLANTDSGTISVALGNGNGTFQARTTYATGSLPWAVSIGDFNGDGKADLVVVNRGNNNVSVLLGNGNGTFQGPTSYGVGATPLSVLVGDFNKDGKQDIIVSNYDSNTVSVLLGTGLGSFQTQTTYATGATPIGLAAADFNGDRKLDIVAVDATYAGVNDVSILLGTGAGGFQAKSTYSVAGSYPIAVNVGDFNGDNQTDLVVANLYSSNVSISLGNGTGAFQQQTTLSTGSSFTAPISVAVADFNGDGRADMAVANQQGKNISLFLNTTVFPNNVPMISAHNTLASSISAGTIDKAYHFTPGAGFSINGHTYVVTNSSYSTSDNIDSVITTTYGSSARMASWQDLISDLNSSTVAQLMQGLALPVETVQTGSYPNLFVSNNGTEFDGSRGRYFVTNFTGTSPGAVSYASFGSVGSLHLGSYGWSGQALVRIDNANVDFASTPENVPSATAVYTVSATDPDASTTLTYSISGGADASLFNINSSTGAVTFKSAPNFEAPEDAGANNVYDITVQASDGSLTATRAVQIAVTDVLIESSINHAPVMTSGGTINNLSASNITNSATQFYWSPELGGNGHIYELVQMPKTFTQALADASLRTIGGIGGHLVTITSQAEDYLLWDKFVQPNSGNEAATPWVALSDAASEGVWKWAAGPEAGQVATNVPWASGENNGGTGENAAVLHWQRERGGFFDYSENKSPWWIVEYEGTTASSAQTVSTPENISAATAVYTVAATDQDANTTLTYSISGGADAAFFNINASTGAVTFKAAPDFESPKDAGANNVYDIIVQASDGALTATQAVQIAVTNLLNETITGTSSRDFLTNGNTANSFIGAGGDDVIVGGTGLDTAYYTGRYSDYKITANTNGSYTVQDLRAGSPEGTDTLTGVEKLVFADASTMLQAPVSNALNVFAPLTAVVGTAVGRGDPNSTNSYMFRPALSNWSGNKVLAYAQASASDYSASGVMPVDVTVSTESAVGSFVLGQNVNFAQAYVKAGLGGTKTYVDSFIYGANASDSNLADGGLLWLDLGTPSFSTYSLKYQAFSFDLFTDTVGDNGSIKPTGPIVTVASGLEIFERGGTGSIGSLNFYSYSTLDDTGGKTVHMLTFDKAGRQVGGIVDLAVLSTADASW